MIEIDGSAGGQILRTSIALSAITKKPCHVFNIRRNRPKQGLMPQHLLGIQNVAKLCSGYLEGDKIGSKEIKFHPGEITAKNLRIRIETAASIALLLQSLLPVSLFAPNSLRIHLHGGGTDVPFSPTFDHFRLVFLKILEKMGVKIEIEVLKRGYYPAGGGEINVEVFPSKLKPIKLSKRGQLQKILIISGSSEPRPPTGGRGKKVAERQLSGVREILGKLKLPIEERVECYQTSCPGSQICLIAKFENTVIGIDNLGKFGKPAENVGKEAALEFLKEGEKKTCLDKHLADQILPYLALAGEKSEVTVSEITNHCKTNIGVIEKFIDGKFETDNELISWIPNPVEKI